MSESLHPLGPHLRALRVAAGVTGSAVARVCGVSRSLVTKWDRGECSPGLAALHPALDLLAPAVSAATGRPVEVIRAEALTIAGVPSQDLRVFVAPAPHTGEAA